MARSIVLKKLVRIVGGDSRNEGDQGISIEGTDFTVSEQVAPDFSFDADTLHPGPTEPIDLTGYQDLASPDAGYDPHMADAWHSGEPVDAFGSVPAHTPDDAWQHLADAVNQGAAPGSDNTGISHETFTELVPGPDGIPSWQSTVHTKEVTPHVLRDTYEATGPFGSTSYGHSEVFNPETGILTKQTTDRDGNFQNTTERDDALLSFESRTGHNTFSWHQNPDGGDSLHVVEEKGWGIGWSNKSSSGYTTGPDGLQQFHRGNEYTVDALIARVGYGTDSNDATGSSGGHVTIGTGGTTLTAGIRNTNGERSWEGEIRSEVPGMAPDAAGMAKGSWGPNGFSGSITNGGTLATGSIFDSLMFAVPFGAGKVGSMFGQGALRAGEEVAISGASRGLDAVPAVVETSASHVTPFVDAAGTDAAHAFAEQQAVNLFNGRVPQGQALESLASRGLVTEIPTIPNTGSDAARANIISFADAFLAPQGSTAENFVRDGVQRSASYQAQLDREAARRAVEGPRWTGMGEYWAPSDWANPVSSSGPGPIGFWSTR